jgi:hypothetical protein
MDTSFFTDSWWWVPVVSFFTDTWWGVPVAIFLLLLAFAIISIRGNTKQTAVLNKAILAELKKLNAYVEKSDTEEPTSQICPQCGQINSIGVMECVNCAAQMPPV